MDLLVVPPLTDFTTEVVPPAGMEPLDLNAHLVRRLADPARLRAAVGRHAVGPLTALFGLAAAAILERRAYDDAHLRAVGTALGLAGDPAVRLAIDGLELVEGSRQSSRDLLAAARRCELFRPEVELARQAADGRHTHVVVDVADQLPGAFALVEALGPGRVTLCGRFAAEHAAALGRVPELAGVRWGSWSPERVIRPHWCARRRHGDHAPGLGDHASGPDDQASSRGRSGSSAGERVTASGRQVFRSGERVRRAGGWVRWVTGAGLPPERGPWAGWLDAERVAAFPREALARCAGLTLVVTRADFLGAATGMNGVTVNLRGLMAAIPRGVPVTCELAVGAPGVPAGVVVESAELLADGAGGVRLGGLRPYRMGIRATWAGNSVRFPPAAGDDLARWLAFGSPDTMRPREVAMLIRRWQERLPGLLPGRLAACSVALDSPGPGPAWDPCAEVVAGAGPDGHGPGTFAVNLRSGRSFRLHQRLIVPVTRLSTDPHALDGLTPPAREHLTAQLTRAGVLRRCP
ncbi:MAG TPA: hypothetical protein VFV66_00515 [Nonomuraea sp.]|nr:hypothetical protein [Nonomuraea sp.]